MFDDNSWDVFIAYYGNEQNGTEKKARQLCKDLNRITRYHHTIKAYCKPEIDTTGTFSSTPRIVQRTPLFLLVVDKKIPRDRYGQLLEKDPDTKETKQLYLEVDAFRTSKFYKSANDKGMVAKLFIVEEIDELSYEDASFLDPIFSGASQFKESFKGYSNTVDEIADWIIQNIQRPEEPEEFFSQIALINELKTRNANKKYIDNIIELYRVVAKEYCKIPSLLGNDIDRSSRHVKRVLNTIHTLIQDDIETLSDIELTILISSVLIHDISLCVDKNEIQALEKNDTIEGSNLHLSTIEKNLFQGKRQLAIRYIFERTRDLRMEETFTKLGIRDLFHGVFENYIQDVIDCVQIHDHHFGDDNHYFTVKNLDGQRLDLSFISTLVHIGDILDYDISGTSEERNYFNLSNVLKCSESDSGIPSLIISNIDKKIRKSTSLCYNSCESCEKCPREVYIQAVGFKMLRPRIKNEYRNCDREKYDDIQCKICEYTEYLEREIKKCKSVMKTCNSTHRLNLEDQVKYINNEPVKPNHKIDIDYSTTVSLLLGEHIYGSRRVGLREIIQNCIDACKYRLTRTKQKRSYKPSINICLDKSNNEIAISDNGIGMSRYVIDNYFLKIGQSLYGSEIYRESDNQFYHAGHYGIGFFASFMLSESVTIYTRHMDDNASWSVKVSTNGRYASISQLAQPLEIGTTIILDYKQVEQNFNIYNIKNFDLLYEIKSYIARFFLADIQEGTSIEITIDDIYDPTDEYKPKGSSMISLMSINNMLLPIENKTNMVYDLSKYLTETQCVIETDCIQDYQWYKYIIKEGEETFIRFSEMELGIYDSIIYKKIFHQGKCVCLFIPPEYWTKDNTTGFVYSPFNYDGEDRQAVFAARTEIVHGSITVKQLFDFLGWTFPEDMTTKPITAFIGKYFIKKVANDVIVYLKNASFEHREPNEGATLNGRQFRDDIYIRNVFIPDFHILSPYTLISINEKHIPEIKKMIINIDREGVYPNLDRNNVPSNVKNDISYAICMAVFRWYFEHIDIASSFDLYAEAFSLDLNNTFINYPG